mgnify:CR=1 FL=1
MRLSNLAPLLSVEPVSAGWLLRMSRVRLKVAALCDSAGLLTPGFLGLPLTNGGKCTMKILFQTIVVAAISIAIADDVHAQGKYSDHATQAKQLADRATSNLRNALSDAFGSEEEFLREKRAAACQLVWQTGYIEEEAVDYILGRMASLPNNRTPRYQYRDISSAKAILVSAAARYRLERADAYLSAKCEKQANTLYREVLEIFAEGPYEGYRARAQVGIEDVRELRRSLAGEVDDD